MSSAIQIKKHSCYSNDTTSAIQTMIKVIWCLKTVLRCSSLYWKNASRNEERVPHHAERKDAPNWPVEISLWLIGETGDPLLLLPGWNVCDMTHSAFWTVIMTWGQHLGWTWVWFTVKVPSTKQLLRQCAICCKKKSKSNAPTFLQQVVPGCSSQKTALSIACTVAVYIILDMANL